MNTLITVQHHCGQKLVLAADPNNRDATIITINNRVGNCPKCNAKIYANELLLEYGIIV